MEQDSVKNIINNAIIANRNNKYSYEKDYVSNFAKAIRENFELFESANEIDLNNENGFKLDNNLIDKILKKYENTDPLIESKDIISLMDNQLLNSKLYTKLGVVLVMFDGNTYTMLEMILLGLLTHNTMIFTYNGYMGGTNGLLIKIVQTILEKEKLKKEMFQHSVTLRSNEFFDNFKSINKTVIIGNNEFINKYLKECTTETIVSGYQNYDIYIDSLKNIDFINKILMQKLYVNIYIKSSLKTKIEDAIFVEDIDEAITYINYNSSLYCSSIFTEDNENASKFINSINSRYVMVNTSPTIEQSLDISQENLLKEKNIMVPNIYKFDGNDINLKISKDDSVQ
jgi:gamma-glutamyl phosphate reductase